jgi:hypothetical protein
LTFFRNFEGVAAHDLKVYERTRLLARQYGSLWESCRRTDGALYVLTNNASGRGTPRPDDNRVLRLSFATP